MTTSGQITLTGRYLDLARDCMREVQLVTYRNGDQTLILADGEQFGAGDELPVTCRDKTAADLVRRLGSYFEVAVDRTGAFDPDCNADKTAADLVARFLASK